MPLIVTSAPEPVVTRTGGIAWPGPNDNPARLRRVLQDARNPARNDLLARTAYGLLTQQMLREAAASCGVTEDASWTEAVEKNVLFKAMQAAVRKAIEEADKLWGH